MYSNIPLRTEEEFIIEKNAKNKAYAFIIAHNLLDEFRSYCARNKDVDNWHLVCVNLLAEKAPKTR